MCASCTVIKKTGLGMIRSNNPNNFNVICDNGQLKGRKKLKIQARLVSMKSVSNLRELLIMVPVLYQLKLDNSGNPVFLSAKIKGLCSGQLSGK